MSYYSFKTLPMIISNPVSIPESSLQSTLNQHQILFNIYDNLINNINSAGNIRMKEYVDKNIRTKLDELKKLEQDFAGNLVVDTVPSDFQKNSLILNFVSGYNNKALNLSNIISGVNNLLLQKVATGNIKFY